MNCIIMVIINCSSYSTSFKFFNYKFKYRGEKNEFSNWTIFRKSDYYKNNLEANEYLRSAMNLVYNEKIMTNQEKNNYIE